MASHIYDRVLEMAKSLSRDEQLRLVESLETNVTHHADDSRKTASATTSILALSGLGSELWFKQDAQAYVDRERSSWNG